MKRVPAYIVALFAGTLAAAALQLDVATIGSRFGGIPSGFPDFQMPAFRPDLVLTLLSPALTVAMLGAIESLLSAVVADRMGGDRHNPNTELFAQGVANVISPLFGGLPATGALARTATNIRSGARSPVAGHHPRGDAARRADVCRPLRRLRADAGAGGDPLRGRLEHGRVARDRRDSQADLRRRPGVAGDVHVDRPRRSDRGGRGRDGAGGAAVHPARRAHDDGVASDAGVHRGRPRRTSCRTR